MIKLLVDQMIKFFNQQSNEIIKCSPIKRKSIFFEEDLRLFISKQRSNIQIGIKKSQPNNSSIMKNSKGQYSNQNSQPPIAQIEYSSQKKQFLQQQQEKLNDFSYILIIHIDAPKFYNQNTQILYSLHAVIFDVSKGTTRKDNYFMQLICHSKNSPQEYKNYYYELDKFKKNGISFLQAYALLNDFINNLTGKIAIMTYSLNQYQSIFMESLRQNDLLDDVLEVFKKPFSLEIELKYFKNINKNNSTFHDIDFSLHKYDYNNLEFSWMMGNIMEKMQKSGYEWKSTNRTEVLPIYQKNTAKNFGNKY